MVRNSNKFCIFDETKHTTMIKIDEKEFLNDIFSDFVNLFLWFPSSLEKCYELDCRIRSNIELIEVSLWGSTGGGLYKNPLPKDITSGDKLYDRFLKIVMKYKLENKIKYEGTTIWDLRDFYKKYE